MIFIDACFGKKTPYTPIWMMRQAGRYLKEYQEVRKKANNFISMCQDVEIATEITLQPVDILDVDAAILFSDILLLPNEMGLKLEFKDGFGPNFLNTISSANDINNLKKNVNLDYVYDIVSSIRKKLDKNKALIGFSGAPFTLATYMIEGSGSKTYEKTKRMLYQNSSTFHLLLQKLSDEIKSYLDFQIKAGANCIMIFDSWANALEYNKYMECGWKYLQDITNFLKNKNPHIPIIVFPRGVGAFLERLNGNFDVMSVDWQIPIKDAKHKIGNRFVIQGNLEPARLYDYESMKSGIEEIINVMKNKKHIFNLGHGMIKDLPRENAINLVKLVRELSSKFA